MTRVIFSTIHGSGLYGLAHGGSDLDIFTVTSSRSKKVLHRIREDEPGKVVDTTEVGLNHFLALARSGSHQSVEALFSRRKMWVLRDHEAMIESTRVTGSDVFEKYERTIRKFCYGDLKRRRHACRLAFNLSDLRTCGRFNPEMTKHEIDSANRLASSLDGKDLEIQLLCVEAAPND